MRVARSLGLPGLCHHTDVIPTLVSRPRRPVTGRRRGGGVPTHTPNHRRARRPPVAAEKPLLARYLLLGASVGLLVLAVAVAVLLATRSTDTLSASAAGPSGSPQSPAASATRPAGIETRVNIGSERVMTVSQRVSLDRPAAQLTLIVPKRTTTVSGGLFRPRIKGLRITMGKSASLNVRRRIEPGDVLTLALPHPARRFTVAYDATGAVRRSQPSSAHRALAVVSLMTIKLGEDVENTIDITGAAVTNIGCIEPSGTAVVCGSATPDGWTVTQNPAQQETVVIAQLNLRR